MPLEDETVQGPADRVATTDEGRERENERLSLLPPLPGKGNGKGWGGKLFWWARRAQRRSISVAYSLYQHKADEEASAMAFWMFLGLVPLAALVGWALARFAHEEVRALIIDVLSLLTPRPAVHLIDAQLRRLSESGHTIAPLSLAGFLWLASRSLHSALTAIQTVRFGRPLPWWRNRLVSMVFVSSALAVLPVGTMVLALASPATKFVKQHGWLPPGWTTFLRYAAIPTSFLATVVVTALFYRIAYPLFSRRDRTSETYWPGAWLSSALWALVTWFLSHHAEWVTEFPLFYGSLAAVALVMIWLWLGSFVLLLGFELNLQLTGVRATQLPPTPSWLEQVGKTARRVSASPSPVASSADATQQRQASPIEAERAPSASTPETSPTSPEQPKTRANKS